MFQERVTEVKNDRAAIGNHIPTLHWYVWGEPAYSSGFPLKTCGNDREEELAGTPAPLTLVNQVRHARPPPAFPLPLRLNSQTKCNTLLRCGLSAGARAGRGTHSHHLPSHLGNAFLVRHGVVLAVRNILDRGWFWLPLPRQPLGFGKLGLGHFPPDPVAGFHDFIAPLI